MRLEFHFLSNYTFRLTLISVISYLVFYLLFFISPVYFKPLSRVKRKDTKKKKEEKCQRLTYKKLSPSGEGWGSFFFKWINSAASLARTKTPTPIFVLLIYFCGPFLRSPQSKTQTSWHLLMASTINFYCLIHLQNIKGKKRSP